MSRSTKALVPYFGAARMTGPKIGKILGPVNWLRVLCSGACAEFPYFDAQAIIASDRHYEVVNLGRAISKDFARFYRSVLARLHHRTIFEKSLANLRLSTMGADLFGPDAPSWAHDYERAADYFAVCWMGRSSIPGTSQEMRNSFSTRNDAGGGGSAIRYYSAVRSLREWRTVLANTTFEVEDALEAAVKVVSTCGPTRDREVARRRAIYFDPPWFDAGDDYAVAMSDRTHREISIALGGAAERGVRVVVRINDHEMTRGLYPESDWTYHELDGRDQTNAKKVELVLVAKKGWQQESAVVG